MDFIIGILIITVLHLSIDGSCYLLYQSTF
jgi:hypothetical protein